MNLEDLLKLQQKIIPEGIELLERRYIILRNIYYSQPVGRRLLSRNLNLSERIIRTEVNFLKEQGFIEINAPGMVITKLGEELISKLKEFVYMIKGLSTLEFRIKERLGLKKVIIVPGNIEEDSSVLKELGKAASNCFKDLLKNGDVVALTGGSTIKSFVDNIARCNNYEDITIVPARGGMGKKLETQSNTLVSNLAIKCNWNYRLLHVPDNLGIEAAKIIMKEKDVIEVMNIIEDADILIYGVGRADEMAKRRGMSEENITKLLEKGALGEAFGHYFNKNGEIVYSTSTMGIKNEKVENIKNIIAIGGGASKAEAIIATQLNKPNGILITDEGASKSILNILNIL
ncbi:central glycolytic genes regulator [Clostridium tetani]|uniref:Sugar-binding transcriptional regulator n=1 Tax=Clostridium tetani TaxID=1513 RepID=A0A4Q0VB64_CLOTA|nr:Cro/Cl family transcriptional regulator [Clostridium tetani]RXI48547.1 sugar-binding transcriptional regulator [Clostridium tetani]RXI75885.1 sugar-binding transcriptional regulator [Clostridium tetani]RXM73210.1 sugar-binding transcriptional regulator [Clostridium tetani]SUY54404.1 central glycolytic genes regulator [Clostridium tetani]